MLFFLIITQLIVKILASISYFQERKIAEIGKSLKIGCIFINVSSGEDIWSKDNISSNKNLNYIVNKLKIVKTSEIIIKKVTVNDLYSNFICEHENEKKINKIIINRHAFQYSPPNGTYNISYVGNSIFIYFKKVYPIPKCVLVVWKTDERIHFKNQTVTLITKYYYEVLFKTEVDNELYCGKKFIIFCGLPLNTIKFHGIVSKCSITNKNTLIILCSIFFPCIIILILIGLIIKVLKK